LTIYYQCPGFAGALIYLSAAVVFNKLVIILKSFFIGQLPAGSINILSPASPQPHIHPVFG
jgi:hypothetical protein